MKTILLLGDSITDCGHSFDPDNLGHGYVRCISEKLSDNIKCINKGIDCFTVPALRRLWKTQCLSLSPDVITILIGINDLAVMKNTGMDFTQGVEHFTKNYGELLEEIRLITDCPIILMEPFIFPYPAEYALWEPELHEMCEAISQLALQYHAQFLPLWDALASAAKFHGYVRITTDGIHLTKLGHEIVAEKLLEMLPIHEFFDFTL